MLSTTLQSFEHMPDFRGMDNTLDALHLYSTINI